jgi:diguanylate cyclase (GGDEF)-like protein/PAS domain S-box-containing protein
VKQDCGSCVCSSAPRTACAGRLVLATRVDHTATALRSLGKRRGTPLRVLAAGLLELDAPDADAFVADARAELSSVEADEVRCLSLPPGTTDAALLGAAMSAPSLSEAGARVTHADLLPLFDAERASFHSVYQPIVDLADGRVLGHEALLRATDADGGPVFPDVLFPAAEAAGWTHVLDRVGRTTALRHAGPWLGEDLLFINFVPTSIYRPQVCLRTTEAAAKEAGLRLDQLVFEVTEGHRVDDVDHLASVFAYYRERGCRVALDDLGAGYSSLNLLVRLQPDFVKLDKDIVQALPDPVSSAVVASVVAITHAYGGLVLAECIETAEQAEAARDLGVDLGQGWFYGRPVRPSRPVEPATATPVDPARPDAAVAVPAQPTAEGDPAPLTDLLSRAVDASASGVVIVDMLADDSPMLYVNRAFERMTGYSSADVVGQNCRLLQGLGSDPDAVAELRSALREGVEHRGVLRNYRKDGSAWWNELHLSPVRDARGRVTHFLGFQHDVTARVEVEKQLVHQAAHDSLTGLANRTTLVAKLGKATARATRDRKALAVLFLDLDGFKEVNDTYGHAAGDAVLAQVAQRLRGSQRGADLLARHGGDEFVAVLLDLDPIDAERVAQRVAAGIIEQLRRPLQVEQGTVRVGVSVGIALLPDHGAGAEELLQAADTAMYEAKAAQPGSIRVSGGRPLWCAVAPVTDERARPAGIEPATKDLEDPCSIR